MLGQRSREDSPFNVQELFLLRLSDIIESQNQKQKSPKEDSWKGHLSTRKETTELYWLKYLDTQGL